MELTTLFVIIASTQVPVVGSMSSFGKIFMVALPKMFPDTSREVAFYMASGSVCLVVITTPNLKFGEELQLIETIHANTFVRSDIEDHFINEVEMDKTHSFRFVGNDSFSLSVFMEYNATNASASFLAVPVQYWGLKYFAVTLNGNPSIQIISTAVKNDVTIRLRMTPGSSSVSYNGQQYGDGATFNVLIDKWEAFSLSKCSTQSLPLDGGNMTGTLITGQFSIGVISGNCLTAGMTGACFDHPDFREGRMLDVVAEMMLPPESYGKEFIILVMVRRMQGYYYTIAETDDTVVSVVDRANKTTSYDQKAGSVKLMAVLTCKIPDCESIKVTSSRPIYVIYVSASACFNSNPANPYELVGNSGLAVVIPVSLFYWKYYFSQFTRANERIIVVIKTAEMKNLQVDDTKFEDLGRHIYPVASVSEWKVIEIELKKKNYLHVVATKVYSNFGCYAIDSVKNGTVISPIGFHRCDYKSKNNPVADDGIDNDCDGQIDEEKDDDKDDDNDTLIDEDIKSGRRAQEDAWTTGIDFKITTMKATGCPPFHWGVNCRSCEACIKECDKDSGMCPGCKAGFKNKQNGCDEECGVNEYGENCEGNCVSKCGKDCSNRQTGECPKEHSKLVFLLILIIPIILLLLWLLSTRYKKKSTLIIGPGGEIIQAPVGEMDSFVGE